MWYIVVSEDKFYKNCTDHKPLPLQTKQNWPKLYPNWPQDFDVLPAAYLAALFVLKRLRPAACERPGESATYVCLGY